MMFERLDTNRDGVINEAEFAAAANRIGAGRSMRAQRLDRRGERFAQRGPAIGGGQRAGARADTNRDGTVTRDEFAAAMLARFDRLDADHDGKVSPGERRVARGLRGPGPAPGRGVAG